MCRVLGVFGCRRRLRPNLALKFPYRISQINSFWLGAQGPSFLKTTLASSHCDNTKKDLENREVREGSCDRPRNLQIKSVLEQQSFPSSDISVQGGGSESDLYHLPPPTKSSSASSSPVLLRRLSATSVASRASQNRLSGGSFKGSKSKLRIVERKNHV